jgi:hypothetical protein
LIIRDSDQERDGEYAGIFTLVSSESALELSVRLPHSVAGEFRAHLTTCGFRVDDDAGTVRSVWSEAIVATAGNPVAWTAVGGTLVAFLHRHRGKVHRIEVEGRSITIEGYSAGEAQQLAEHIVQLSREHERSR